MSELSDEEKKAIENLKEVVDLYNDECLITTDYDFKSIEILLNLIETQQKEIEELKEKNGVLQNELNKKIEALDKAMNNPDYISKDKIKAKIEDLEKQDKESRTSHNYLIIPVLQELLKGE